jgi:hypothetical protein
MPQKILATYKAVWNWLTSRIHVQPTGSTSRIIERIQRLPLLIYFDQSNLVGQHFSVQNKWLEPKTYWIQESSALYLDANTIIPSISFYRERERLSRATLKKNWRLGNYGGNIILETLFYLFWGPLKKQVAFNLCQVAALQHQAPKQLSNGWPAASFATGWGRQPFHRSWWNTMNHLWNPGTKCWLLDRLYSLVMVDLGVTVTFRKKLVTSGNGNIWEFIETRTKERSRNGHAWPLSCMGYPQPRFENTITNFFTELFHRLINGQTVEMPPTNYISTSTVDIHRPQIGHQPLTCENLLQ